MTDIQFTLVTPTFNRAPILSRMLEHLRTVDGIEDCEIIVINDGSTDGTAEVLEEQQEVMPNLGVITLTNGGPARARNAGVQDATNHRILFIDDDVFPRADMLRLHWNMLDRGYDGSQGLLVWHREIERTKLIHYIDSRGSQFAFDRIKPSMDLNSKYIYTGNFAIRRDLVLQAGGFCETLFDRQTGFSAYEDTVLGHSLRSLGADVAFNSEAIADHLHPMSEESFLRREFKVGSCTARLEQLYPEIAKSLALHPRGGSLALQAELTDLLSKLPAIEGMLGYEAAMRLRHRASFLRGYLHYRSQHRMPSEQVAA